MIGQLVLALAILIVLHEGGHYATARWFGIKVEKFYLFLSKYILSAYIVELLKSILDFFIKYPLS